MVHTHDGITHMIKSLVDAWKYCAEDKILHFLPLYHVHGILNKMVRDSQIIHVSITHTVHSFVCCGRAA